MSDEIKAIVEAELKAHSIRPSLRQFGEWLMEGLTKGGDAVISHNTIANWRNGKPPSTDLLEDILAVYPMSDRRFQFALKLLAVKSPHVWGPDGVVWKLKSKLSKAE